MKKWGRFPPECRFNVDQSPCPFVFDSSRCLQKISVMRKCGYHNQVQDLMRDSVLYKFVSVLKENNPHLGLRFVERNCSGVVWYGLPNATDLWQPIDAGYGKMLKTLMEQEHHRWLDDEEHADR